jgi:hypothetical protein
MYYMYRTQLLLEEWQYQSLKSRAEKKGDSISSLVREAVDRYLDEGHAARSGSLDELCGIGRDAGLGARDHDRVLYGPGHPPRRPRGSKAAKKRR